MWQNEFSVLLFFGFRSILIKLTPTTNHWQGPWRALYMPNAILCTSVYAVRLTNVWNGIEWNRRIECHWPSNVKKFEMKIILWLPTFEHSTFWEFVTVSLFVTMKSFYFISYPTLKFDKIECWCSLIGQHITKQNALPTQQYYLYSILSSFRPNVKRIANSKQKPEESVSQSHTDWSNYKWNVNPNEKLFQQSKSPFSIRWQFPISK